MTKIKIVEDDEEHKILKDGERLRVRLDLMDSVQRDVRDYFQAHHWSHHRPGYRFFTDSEAKQLIEDAHEAYRTELSNRWRNTPPEPPIDTPTVPVLDADFDIINDDAVDPRELAYALYDADVSSRWKGE